MKFRQSISTVAAFGCVLAGLSAIPASAQFGATLSNQYLQVTAGIAGEVEGAGPFGSTLALAGRWTVGTTGGDPLSLEDNNQSLLEGFPFPTGAYATIAAMVMGEDGMELVLVRYGDLEEGAWVQVPFANQLENTITDAYILAEAPLLIERTITLLRDMVRVEFQITNLSTMVSQAALGVYLDNEYGSGALPIPIRGGPFYTAAQGTISNEIGYSGQDVPSVIYGFNELPAYKIATQLMLRGGEITTPDEVYLMGEGRGFNNFWLVEPNPARSLLRESATLLYWNSRSIPAGRTSSKYVFYFGLANATSDFNLPGIVSLQGPFSVEYSKDDGERVGELLPDPITITGYVYNTNTSFDMQNVQAFLTLSPGLEFDLGESAQKVIGRIGAGEEQAVTWQIYADGNEFGNLTYSMSVTGTLMNPKTITRTINVPAIEERLFFGGEWEMIGVPFQAVNSDPVTMLDLPFGTFQAIRFNPLSGSYQQVFSLDPGIGFWFRPVSDTIVTLQGAEPITDSVSRPRTITLEPGWNQISNPFIYSIPWGRMQVMRDLTTGPVPLSDAIQRNWIRGTVFWYDIYSAEYDYSSNPATPLVPWQGYWVRALQRVTLIFPPVDTIGGIISASNPAGASSQAGPGNLNQESIYYTMPAMQSNPSALVGPTMQNLRVRDRDRNLRSNAWSVRLAAFGSGGDRDTRNFFGQKTEAQNGYDPADIDKAPPAGSVSVAFLNTDWGENSGRYTTDFRSVSSSSRWAAEVYNAGPAQAVTLSFNDFQNLPNGMRLVLQDTTTGRSQVLRPGSVYRYTAGSGETRMFNISAQHRGRIAR